MACLLVPSCRSVGGPAALREAAFSVLRIGF